MVAVGPPPLVRKAVHDAGFLVILAGLLLAFVAFEPHNPVIVIVGLSLVAVGAAMVWLGSRRPRQPATATVPPAA